MAFRGITQIGETTITNALRSNLITYFDWGFADIGGYFNVDVPTSGSYGGDYSRLRPYNDPSYTSGQVWETRRKNWVWENGLTINTPNNISGVMIDSVLSASGYTLDYINGRVIFDNAISTDSVVQLSYSYKWVSVADANQSFLNLDKDSFRVDDGNFLISSGEHIPSSPNKVQLPMVAIEVLTNSEQDGYELGGYNAWHRTDVIFHIVAEDDNSAKKLSDIIMSQNDTTIHLFDIDRMGALSGFPLDGFGGVVNPSSTWPVLVRHSGDGGFRWDTGVQHGKMSFTKGNAQAGNWLSDSLYTSAVRMTTEVVLLRN